MKKGQTSFKANYIILEILCEIPLLKMTTLTLITIYRQKVSDLKKMVQMLNFILKYTKVLNIIGF